MADTNSTTAEVPGGTIKRGSYIVTPIGLGEVMGIVHDRGPGRPERPIDAVIKGKSHLFQLHEVRKATFRDFAINETGFGKTPWIQFWFIQAFSLALVGTGIVTWADSGWVAVSFAAAIEGVLVYGTWGNFTGRIR